MGHLSDWFACACAHARARARSCVYLSFYNTCLLPVTVEFWGTGMPIKHVISSYITVVHNGVVSGVYVYEQPSHIHFCVAECFLAKLRRCLMEQVCQGRKV